MTGSGEGLARNPNHLEPRWLLLVWPVDFLELPTMTGYGNYLWKAETAIQRYARV
jgi:hypothetical protein